MGIENPRPTMASLRLTFIDINISKGSDKSIRLIGDEIKSTDTHIADRWISAGDLVSRITGGATNTVSQACIFSCFSFHF
jgi:hypothetical protein